MDMLGQTLLFLDIGTGEFILIFMVVFIVFGPSKIPEMTKKIGRGIYEIKRASNEIKREIDTEVRKLERDVDIDAKKTVKKPTVNIKEEKSEAKPEGKSEVKSDEKSEKESKENK